MSTSHDFDQFTTQVRQLLDQTAGEKAYANGGPDGPNPLYELVSSIAGGHGHALGEIVYKAVRYGKKGDPEDLAKIAAWAFLAWRFAVAARNGAGAHVAAPLRHRAPARARELGGGRGTDRTRH